MQSFDAAPVKVNVGFEKKIFYVHATTLTASSEFFKSALKEVWMTRNDTGIDLPDYCEETFKEYVQWLSSGNSIANAEPADDYASVHQN